MTIKIYTVECSVHGKMEIETASECPRLCFIPVGDKRCSKQLKRIYDAPNIHFKGEGFTKSNR